MEVNVKTQKLFLILIAISLVMLIGPAIGCGPAPVIPAEKPTISSFSASPPSVTQGQQTVLSWNVTGVRTVDIQPALGSMGPTGALTLTPNATVTYTLTAANEAGSVSSTTTVNVIPVVAGQPDLVIENLFLQTWQVYYVIKNQGNAVAPPNEITFYLGIVDPVLQKINWLKQTSNFVDYMAPGEERTGWFTNYEWKYSPTPTAPGQGAGELTGLETYNVKACINDKNAFAESNTTNNCLMEAWGPGYTYDFFKQAHLAKWTSGVGPLFWPMVAEEYDGAAYRITYNPILVICPQKINQGWIMDRFGDFYEDPETSQAMIRDIQVPILTKFTTKVGFAPGVSSPDGVTVALGYFDQFGSLVFFNKMPVMSDGQMHDYTVDLSSLAAKHTQFILWEECNGSPTNTCLRWDSPKLIQIGEFQ